MADASDKPKAMLGSRAAEWIIPVAAVALVFVMLVPLPAFVLDLLLAISITASVLVLLSAVHILRPVQFSVFPSLLLLLTLFRLSLNLASSRRILLHGNEGSSAAGHVIEAFGQFVVGGNYVVGFVLFLALIAIQYMVVSHGAVRTAEVTARFTLDALPGKQMAIDADLNAGVIDEKQARSRREQVSREAEFYGAMDGAARFNQRDSLATMLITAINIIAGFLIGVFQLDVPFREALKTYTILTVGDGLVTIIPSLLVSVGGGIVVTRSSSDNSLGGDIGTQLFGRSRPLWIAAGAMTALAMIPGLPKIPFLAIAGGAAWLARRAKREFEKPVAALRSCCRGRNCSRRSLGTRRFGRSAEAGRSGPGSRLCAGAAGRCQAGRAAAAAGQSPAPASGVAAGLHRSAGPHHRQPEVEAARVCGFPARGRDRPLGDA